MTLRRRSRARRKAITQAWCNRNFWLYSNIARVCTPSELAERKRRMKREAQKRFAASANWQKVARAHGAIALPQSRDGRSFTLGSIGLMGDGLQAAIAAAVTWREGHAFMREARRVF